MSIIETWLVIVTVQVESTQYTRLIEAYNTKAERWQTIEDNF